ncbi:MAG: exodeoxyribonuclease large subunit, partial [Bacteroidota bacterium]
MEPKDPMNESKNKIRLSELALDIQNVLRNRYEGRVIWVTAQITDVKKQVSLKRCYLKFIEKQGTETLAEIRGVFWANSYSEIERFEKITGKLFSDGLEINCQVIVKFHPRFGLSLEVQEIEIAYALGSLELERQQTLERLVREHPTTIQVVDGIFFTPNKSLPLPPVIQSVALI